MSFSIFQVDAFASRPFEGNPAAVVPLDQWLPDDVMQSIAAGDFREDLYYRLNVIPIKVPSLKERSSDIPLLTDSGGSIPISTDTIVTQEIMVIVNKVFV